MTCKLSRIFHQLLGIAILLASMVVAPVHSAHAGEAPGFDHGCYARVLENHVDGEGMVDYAGLKKNRGDLDRYVRQLGAVSPQAFAAWPEPDRIALWINAYNALTLRLVVEHYPVRRRITRVLFPVGIRHIPGAWDTESFTVMGRKLTLNEIEHEILRKEYRYPALHLSLVCAALSCPPLRGEPYEGARLDAQHADQTRRFLQNPAKFRIDHQARIVYLSPIFDWFGEDFIATHGARPVFLWGSPKERAVMSFIAPYVGDADRVALKSGDYTVRYLSYDWSLNSLTSP